MSPLSGKELVISDVPCTILDEKLPSEEWKAFFASVRSGDHRAVRAKLEQGVDATTLDLALHRARDSEMVRLLVGAGSQALDAGMHGAAIAGLVPLLELYLALGASVNYVSPKGNSALRSAAGHNHREATARLLQEHPTEPKVVSGAVRVSVQEGHREMFEYLVAQGLPPEGEDGSGSSSLKAAAGRGRIDFLDRLIELGVSLQGEAAEEAFAFAVRRGQSEACRHLLQRGLVLRKRRGQKIMADLVDAGAIDLVLALGEAGHGAKVVTQKNFVARFGFLCSSPEEQDILNALGHTLASLREKKRGGMTLTFLNGEKVVCDPPFTEEADASLPASYRNIAAHFNGILWECGGPSMGFPGLNAAGQPADDGGFALSFLKESDPETYSQLVACETEPTLAFACGQNWLFFDPLEEASAGKTRLAFVDHGDCLWQPVTSAQPLGCGGVLLRLWSDAFLGTNFLPEVFG